jgi:hypothetical protein
MNSPCVALILECFWWVQPPSKMDAVTENRKFSNWPNSPYFKPESACILIESLWIRTDPQWKTESL